MLSADIGLIGLGVMGESLALNIAGHGYTVAVFNRTTSKIDAFLDGLARGQPILGAYSPRELVGALRKPRRILIMVTAGSAVDAVIADLVPLLEPGDILMDGGNSYFADTQRRVRELESQGLLFVGMGISGGEEGALKGPSIMPGGSSKAWPQIKKLLQDIAAKAEGSPCCEWIGPDGAGHFVKMVHNGIEYADMQLIAEAYFLLREALGLRPPELAKVFGRWNDGDLNSYLMDITSRIFRQKDAETGEFLVDVILDAAAQKGTGAWTSQVALELGEPVPTIAEAVFARCMSALKEERAAAANLLPGPNTRFQGGRDGFVEDIRLALHASKICSYAQGFQLMRAAAEEYNWPLRYGEIAAIWRAGCIIRAQFLNRIREAYDRDPQLASLLLDPYFRSALEKSQSGWRRVVGEAVRLGLPVPALSSALAYYDAYRTARLPANLLQAQRDFFGAHTYERTDRPRGEFFHTEWES